MELAHSELAQLAQAFDRLFGKEIRHTPTKHAAQAGQQSNQKCTMHNKRMKFILK